MVAVGQRLTDLNTARYGVSGCGTSTASLAVGGRTLSSPDTVAFTESWNGSSWTEVGEFKSGREQIGVAGTVPAALAFGGERDDGSIYDNNESWNGSAWTEVNDLNTAKNAMGGLELQQMQ